MTIIARLALVLVILAAVVGCSSGPRPLKSKDQSRYYQLTNDPSKFGGETSYPYGRYR